MKVIFLDIDGVISTHRAWNSQLHVEDFYKRWLDPLACGLLLRLCQEHDLKLVISSTWRKFGWIHITESLHETGLVNHLVEDWRTLDLSRLNAGDTRPEEIAEWLSRHSEVEDYLILDDEGSGSLSDEQKKHWIKTHMFDGLSFKDYVRIGDWAKNEENTNYIQFAGGFD